MRITAINNYKNNINNTKPAPASAAFGNKNKLEGLLSSQLAILRGRTSSDTISQGKSFTTLFSDALGQIVGKLQVTKTRCGVLKRLMVGDESLITEFKSEKFLRITAKTANSFEKSMIRKKPYNK